MSTLTTRRGTAHHSRRGYTLLELTVVALLAAALLGLVGRWVAQLGQVALQQAVSTTESAPVYAIDRLEDDLTAASSCRDTETALRSISPSTLELTVDRDGDGIVELVRWSADPITGRLTRAAALDSGDCVFTTLPAGAVILTGVASGTDAFPFFIPLSRATQLEQTEIYGTCATTELDRCRFSGLTVGLTVLDGGKPIVSSHTFPLGL